MKEFYLKTEQPLPFEVEYTYTTYYTEWDDRYDPPQEVNHEESTTATLVSGKLESTHKTHNSGSTGVDNNSGTYVTFTINNKKCNAGEIFIINGKQYLIKCMTI